MPVPRSQGDLSAAFFDAALGLQRGSVRAAEVAPLKAGGLSGAQLYRVVLRYAEGVGGTEAVLPASVVVKVMHAATIVSPALRGAAVERLMTVSAGYSDPNMMRLECVFYSKLAQRFAVEAGVPVPKCYYASIAGHHNALTMALFIVLRRREHVSNVIVMEDLTAAKFVPTTRDIDDNVLELILDAAARLHGHSAKLYQQGVAHRLEPCFHLQLIQMNQGIQLWIKRRLISSKHGRETKRFRRLWGDQGYEALKQSDVFDALVALEKYYARKVDPHLTAMYNRCQCLVHGDLHAGNFAYLPDGTVRMLDWQMYGTGSPAWEISYFLSLNIEPGDLARDERIISTYHAKFVANSGLDYPYATFRRDVDLCILDACATAMVRQARFDTPAKLAKQMKTFMRVYVEEVRGTVQAIDLKTIKRTRDIFLKDKTFDLDLERYRQQVAT